MISQMEKFGLEVGEIYEVKMPFYALLTPEETKKLNWPFNESAFEEKHFKKGEKIIVIEKQDYYDFLKQETQIKKKNRKKIFTHLLKVLFYVFFPLFKFIQKINKTITEEAIMKTKAKLGYCYKYVFLQNGKKIDVEKCITIYQKENKEHGAWFNIISFRDSTYLKDIEIFSRGDKREKIDISNVFKKVKNYEES